MSNNSDLKQKIISDSDKINRYRHSTVYRYACIHIRRSYVRSMLGVLLAALLLTAFCQYELLCQSYKEMITNTTITAAFIDGIPISTMHSLGDNVFVTDVYYEATMQVGMNVFPENLVATNDIMRYANEEISITFLDGYDITIFDKAGSYVVMGDVVMERYGFQLGDIVELGPWLNLDNVLYRFESMHSRDYPDDNLTYIEIAQLYYDRIMQSIRGTTQSFTIVGVISTPSTRLDRSIISPGARDTVWAADMAGFTITDNDRVDEFRVWGERLASASGRMKFIMDTSKIDNPRNVLRLLKTFYPIILVAALLIGGFLCCLVILQLSKEAAIMRVLGVSKLNTGLRLVFEQAILSMIGLALGVVIMLILRNNGILQFIDVIAYFAAIYFVVIVAAGVVCSTFAMRRPPIELLQVKE